MSGSYLSWFLYKKSISLINNQVYIKKVAMKSLAQTRFAEVQTFIYNGFA